jgi:predicted AAA+ superfamily ATPase
LDDEETLKFARADPKSFLKQENRLVIIDEIQKAPWLLPHIKMIVDEDRRKGQFLLTGSADIQALPETTESLAGRVAHVRLCPLTQGEILGIMPTFLNRLDTMDFPNNFLPTLRKDLLKFAFRGGFPEVVCGSANYANMWHLNYINSLILKDLTDLTEVRKSGVVRKLLQVLAGWSSKPITLKEIGSSLEASKETLQNYIGYLRMLYIIEELAPWTYTDYEYVRRKDKIFMGDSGLMTSLLGWDLDAVITDSDRMGKLIETFIFNELFAQIHMQKNIFGIYHYRDREQREIDFIIEQAEGILVGIEVKSGSNVAPDDFNHLKWFEENCAKGRQFRGIVLYNGVNRFNLGKRFAAIPLSALWTI